MASETAGTGGRLPYLGETPEPGMACQERSHSCQVACALQLLRDAGVETTEIELLSKTEYVPDFGTGVEAVGPILDALHPRLGYDYGIIVDGIDLPILLRRDPWIANVLTDYGRLHAVVVDGEHDGTIFVRDPWGEAGPGSGCGTRATMTRERFIFHWASAYYKAIYPNRRK